MDHLHYDADLCIMTKFFRQIGGKWKPIILHLIREDINRFGLLKKSMPRISKKILTEQLRELEEDKLIDRTVLVARAPQTVVYSLTEKGKSLRKLVDEMVGWSLIHLKDQHTDRMINEYISGNPELCKKLPWLKNHA